MGIVLFESIFELLIEIGVTSGQDTHHFVKVVKLFESIHRNFIL